MKILHNTNQNNLQKQVCIVLTVACIALFATYVYFISASIVHVVIRTETMQELKKVGSEISLLEGRFIEAQHRVSSDIASLQGYSQTSHKVFIDRTAPSFVLSDGAVR